jgi:hypothetical protein
MMPGETAWAQTTTPLPTHTLPPLTPTLGPPITRTPAPAAECPKPSPETPTIAFSQNIDEIEKQILAYLNAGGSPLALVTAFRQMALPDPAIFVKGTVFTVDVTGDTTPDVVMDWVVFANGATEGTIFVFSCNQGRYQTVHVANFGGTTFLAPDEYENAGLRAVQDMNQDGVPEIVYAFVYNAGFVVGAERLFYIIEWDGADFVNLVFGSLDRFGRFDPCECAIVSNGDGEIRDTNGDGYLELTVTWGLPLQDWIYDYPPREWTDIFAWNGTAFTLARSEDGPPAYRLHALWDGDDASRLGRYDEALALYQRVIFDESLLPWWKIPTFSYPGAYADEPQPPDPDERPRLSAYARYRIMLLHIVQGNFAEAKIVYDTLLSRFPLGSVGHQYAELATLFWDEYQKAGDIAPACEIAIQHTEAAAAVRISALKGIDSGTTTEEEMRSATSQDILAPIDSYEHSYAPDHICPFG